MVELRQLDLKRGLQEPQLQQQLAGHAGRFRNSENGRKQVRQL
jgi:hypothetical protein